MYAARLRSVGYSSINKRNGTLTPSFSVMLWLACNINSDSAPISMNVASRSMSDARIPDISLTMVFRVAMISFSRAGAICVADISALLVLLILARVSTGSGSDLVGDQHVDVVRIFDSHG